MTLRVQKAPLADGLTCRFALAAMLLLLVWSSSTAAAQEITTTTEEDQHCSTLHVDFLRRQAEEWDSLDPYTIEQGTKHTPFLHYNSETNVATVIVGNGNETGGVYHPMDASDDPSMVHFITHIYVVEEATGDIVVSQTMDPTMPAPATFSFVVPDGVTELTAYEFCNLHGLWKGPTVAMDGSNSTTTSKQLPPAVCQVESPVQPAYDSFAADFVRRQQLPPFNNMNPYTEDDGTLHTPYITVHTNNNTATVIVGTDEKRHVMEGAGDGGDPHWITTIYVLNQDGEIVTMRSLDPTHVDHAEISFDIPDDATELTAYEWCNIHGLYVGPTYNAETGQMEKEGDEGSDGSSQQQASGGGTVMTKNVFLVLAAVAGQIAMMMAIA